jgi:hypothetical protein
MASLGFDPRDASTNASRPAGVGNLAAQALLEFRHADGANQLGNYADYTGYVLPNSPMDLVSGAFDPATVHDPNAWQPLRYRDASGAVVTPGFVGAQWQHVTPFALASSGMLRSPTGPARYGSSQYLTQAQQLLSLSAGLTDEQKMIAELWADGPRSEQPPGHWNLFAEFIARRDRHGDEEHGIDLDIKLFFVLTNAIFDAGICAWDNKCEFASVRPITATRYLFHGQPVTAWAGPIKARAGTTAGRGSPTSRRRFQHRRSPSTPPDTATSAPRAQRSCAGLPDETSLEPPSHFLQAVRVSSPAQSLPGSSRCSGRRSPTPRIRRASLDAMAASTSNREISTRARQAARLRPPRGRRRGRTSTAPPEQNPDRRAHALRTPQSSAISRRCIADVRASRTWSSGRNDRRCIEEAGRVSSGGAEGESHVDETAAPPAGSDQRRRARCR